MNLQKRTGLLLDDFLTFYEKVFLSASIGMRVGDRFLQNQPGS
jgi:hypothetical protein